MNLGASKRTVGIVGYGQLGQFLAHAILEDPKVKNHLQLGFVWNRTQDKILEDSKIPKELILQELDDFPSLKVDLIIEVAHPKIIASHGERFLQHADLMVGSPTAFSDSIVESKIRTASSKGKHGCYIPSGALWGAEDIEKMASLGNLGGLTVTMKKYPSSLKVESHLMEKLKSYIDSDAIGEFVVYEGPVRELCPLAPNNVNTMACAAIAASNLGFDKVKARLVADKSLEAHVIDIEIVGPPKENPDEVFRVNVSRYNPAKPGAVTGAATYTSFLSSMVRANGRGNGFHFC